MMSIEKIKERGYDVPPPEPVPAIVEYVESPARDPNDILRDLNDTMNDIGEGVAGLLKKRDEREGIRGEVDMPVDYAHYCEAPDNISKPSFGDVVDGFNNIAGPISEAFAKKEENDGWNIVFPSEPISYDPNDRERGEYGYSDNLDSGEVSNPTDYSMDTGNFTPGTTEYEIMNNLDSQHDDIMSIANRDGLRQSEELNNFEPLDDNYNPVFNENIASPTIDQEMLDLQNEVDALNIQPIEEIVATMNIIDTADIPRADDTHEWLGEINPNYDPWDMNSPYNVNCGSCAFAVSQRLDGDTEIIATATNIGTTSEMNEITGMEQMTMSPDGIQEYLISLGPGSHGIVGIDRSEGPGHWFNAYYDGERVVAIDGQTGEVNDWPPDYGDVINWDISVQKGV
jgi:hypothetical protein